MSTTALHQSTHRFELDRVQPVHFIGVSGIGMSGLARVLVDAGFSVSGSDLHLGGYTDYLRDQGAHLSEGHAAENVPQNALVVASTAINLENPEFKIAKSRELPIIHRSDLLREVLHHPQFKHHTVIGVSGTHGKTSTTGMIGVALAAVTDPTIVAGGIIPELATNAQWGDSGYAVAELDESDGTLVQYHPQIAIMLNLELDHAEHFPGGMADFIEMFRQFLLNLPADAKAWINAGCPESMALFKRIQDDIQWQPVFFADDPDILYQQRTNIPLTAPQYALDQTHCTSSGCYAGTILFHGEPLQPLEMSTPGIHQLLNGLVAASVIHQLALPLDPPLKAIGQFKGMKRRFERLGSYQGVTLIDDYAHHPTEVAAILKATRECMTAVSHNGEHGRLIAIFQPHRFTRLKTFWNEFQTCFSDVDELTVLDVYEASEEPLPGIHSEAFTALLQQQPSLQGKAIHYFGGKDVKPLIQSLQSQVKPGDWVITLGAGDVTNLLRGWPVDKRAKEGQS